MLKSYGVGGGVGGPCDFSVSPRSKSFFFLFLGGLLFNLGACWDKGLDSDLDQGLTILKKVLFAMTKSSYHSIFDIDYNLKGLWEAMGLWLLILRYNLFNCEKP